MKCHGCGSIDSKVVDSRLSDDAGSIRRRRECLSCGRRYTTFERLEITPVLVVKSNGDRQAFDVSKIKKGILKSTEKRPIAMRTIDEMVNDIERKVQNSLAQEISSRQIGEMVMAALKKVDAVSYIRFASVYKNFKDIEDVKREVGVIEADNSK